MVREFRNPNVSRSGLNRCIGDGADRAEAIAVQDREFGGDPARGVFGSGDADRGAGVEQQLLKVALTEVADLDRAEGEGDGLRGGGGFESGRAFIALHLA